MSEYRLVMKGVVKTFPGVKALDHAQLELRPGKVMALMGENGAGKSTLMKCMFGIYKMDEGEIEYEGEKVNIPTPLDALNRGIAMVHQELQPIPARTVAENIWLGRYPIKKAGPITIVDHAKMYKDTDDLLKKLKLDINSHAKLGTLSIAQMQMVEIAKAVSANCKVLILDEPTSSLTANEVESLFRIMNELKEQGVALVYISHKMDEIKVIADEVTIMRDGHYIGKWDVANMTKEQIIAKMVGRELSNLYPPLENHPSDEIMMKVEDFTSIHPRSFRHCSFELKKGEILGVAGLVGAQRTELMEGIFGLRAHTAGKVWIKGQEVTIKQPRDAIQKSVALLTEDRRATGIMGVLSVADNISIASLDALRKGPIMLDNKKILDLVATNKEKMAIKVPSPKTQIKSLSGGNQQKAIIAREIDKDPKLLVAVQPTRGLDVGAIEYIHRQIVAERDGLGQVLVEPQRPGDGAGDLGDFQRVGQAGAVEVALRREEDLRFLLEPPERLAVEHPVAVPLEHRADGVLFLRSLPAPACIAERRPRGQRQPLDLFGACAHIHPVSLLFSLVFPPLRARPIPMPRLRLL